MSIRKKDEPSTDVALPIVPMLDMSFQILFFFIITFNPNPSEGQMTMNLPASGTSQSQSNLSMTNTSDIEVEVPSDYIVEVKSYEANLSVRIRQSDKPNPDDIGSVAELDKLTAADRAKAVNALMDKLAKALSDKLEEKRKDNPNAAKNVKIEANSTMKYGLLVSVMDACIRAGYEQVGFVAPPDLGQ